MLKWIKCYKDWVCFNCEKNIPKGTYCYCETEIIDYNSTKEHRKSRLYLCEDCGNNWRMENEIRHRF